MTQQSSKTQTTAEQYYEIHKKRIFAELSTFLRFQSVSADPNRHAECLDCAHWLSAHLTEMGCNAQIVTTPTLPVVYAEYLIPGAPTVLFYGHYDVQPEGDRNAWTSAPFEASERDGRIYARGAADDKGQVFYFLKALEYLIANARLQFSVRIVIEGEEESGGKGIQDFVSTRAPSLTSDVLMVCDTGLVPSGDPTVMIGLRGICYTRFALHGPNRELHSGHHGGVAPNPLLGMASLLHSLINADGSIAVRGYYDDVKAIPDAALQMVVANPFDAITYESEVGVAPLAGEQLFPVPQRVGLRPSIEIHGVSGGYCGPGVKTIVPTHAEALISSRLVWGQDPGRCLRLIEEHLHRHTPKGLRLSIMEAEVGGPALFVEPNNRWIEHATRILNEVSGRQVFYRCNGGSIPVIADLAAASGSTPLLVGFSRDSDRIHAVDESFEIERFELGYKYVSSFLASRPALEL
jgi:acetylornithine deacetylase/succinyl-diaminopimelate desuccinylase-like protein